MANIIDLDALFREAVGAIDAGDIASLDRMLAANPELVRDRLDSPGAWLRDKVGHVVDAGEFFERPYLLWFVAEDPVRNGRLPKNIADVARSIIHAAKIANADRLQVQLDYALQLVSLSWIARQCHVQIELIDALIDVGASPDGNPDHALVNGNFDAAEHLVRRGAPITLAAALCLERWEDASRLLAGSSERQKQFAFVLAALSGRADALRLVIRNGVDLNRPSEDLFSHGTPVHHAVCSGSLDAVKVLVEAGAKLATKDTVWNATPLEWAEHYMQETQGKNVTKPFPAIAAYLRGKASRP